MAWPTGARWIAGFERRYAIQPDGTVWSLCYYQSGFFKRVATPVRQGRTVVQLCRGHGARTRSTFGVAWLVLNTFGRWRRKPGQVPVARDGSLAHCTIANLRWGWPKDRWRSRARQGRGAKLSGAQAREIFRARRAAGAVARVYGVSPCLVRHIRNGYRWAAATRPRRSA